MVRKCYVEVEAMELGLVGGVSAARGGRHVKVQVQVSGLLWLWQSAPFLENNAPCHQLSPFG
jgi:hypothetical protein